METQWKEIEGYNGDYLVSDDGRVVSLKSGGWRILRPNTNRRGYVYVVLCSAGKTRTHSVHRLVADAFIPNPEYLPDVNHKDGIKTNNTVGNLEWATAVANMHHSWREGVRSPVHSLDSVRTVHQLRAEGLTQEAIGQTVGMSQRHVSRILRGECRLWVDGYQASL